MKVMFDHSNINSSIRSLLSGSPKSSNQQKKRSSNSSILPYISSSIYNKKMKTTPKCFTFDVTFYNNPGNIMKGNTIDEKKMVQIGNGNIVLYEQRRRCES